MIANLIARGAKLKASIAEQTKELKEIEADILRRCAPGKHQGDENTSCSVIAPAATIKLSTEDVDKVKELTGDETFKKLFERTVTFKPVKAFRDLLAALVGKREQKKVLELTQGESTSYVKW